MPLQRVCRERESEWQPGWRRSRARCRPHARRSRCPRECPWRRRMPPVTSGTSMAGTETGAGGPFGTAVRRLRRADRADGAGERHAADHRKARERVGDPESHGSSDRHGPARSLSPSTGKADRGIPRFQGRRADEDAAKTRVRWQWGRLEGEWRARHRQRTARENRTQPPPCRERRGLTRGGGAARSRAVTRISPIGTATAQRRPLRQAAGRPGGSNRGGRPACVNLKRSAGTLRAAPGAVHDAAARARRRRSRSEPGCRRRDSRDACGRRR